MRGISPVIATVIILAVTVAIAVAVIGWITGLFGAATGGTEQLQIMPDSYINASDLDLALHRVPGLHLHIVNRGSDVKVYKIEIVETRETLSQFYILEEDEPSIKAAYDAAAGRLSSVIKSGSDVWLIQGLSKEYVAGNVYTVKVYTSGGNVFVGKMIARG